MWKDKKYRRILLACIFASLAAVAGFFVLSRTYIKNLVYKERLNQMEEITHPTAHHIDGRKRPQCLNASRFLP